MALPAKAPYRMSHEELKELKVQLEELLVKGYIKSNKSPYGAPIFFVHKKDGMLRMCVDYRTFNKATVKNRYLLPRIDDLFDRLSGAKVFSRIDLCSGYYQIQIVEGDEEKTACRTRYSSYKFMVMPFGLTYAPATFCTLMNDIFREWPDDFVVIYINDILIYSGSLEEHAQHLGKVFQRLRENKLYAKHEKCEFGVMEVHFLGHKITQEGLKMDDHKVKAIVDWRPPKLVPALRSFLGLALSQPHFRAKCENATHTPKSGKMESFGTPKTSEDNLKGQISLHWSILYINEMVLKCKCPKWPRMGHLDICSPSYGQKKGWESNWQFDSRSQKVKN
jgi:hypothetical protein